MAFSKTWVNTRQVDTNLGQQGSELSHLRGVLGKDGFIQTQLKDVLGCSGVWSGIFCCVVCGRRPCGCVMLLEECQVAKDGMEKCLSCVVWGVWGVLKCMGELAGKMRDAVETG